MASVGVLDRVRAAASELRAVVAGLDADALSGANAETLVRELSAVVNTAQAGVAKVARRLEETARWKQANTPSPEALLGKLTGGSNIDGRRLLETSRRLAGLGATREAMEQGRVSVDQAAQIAAAAGEMADAGRAEEAEAVEADLLGVAQRGNFGALRSAAERARQAARDQAAQADHLRKTRFFRKRRFDDGGVGGTFKLEPGVAAEVYAVLDAEADRQFRLARAEGRGEGADAYAADALVHTVVGDGGPDGGGPAGGSGRARRVEIVGRVDVAALYRGYPMAGELSEIVGVGPVPVEVLRDLLGEALLTLVLTDGVDVMNVTCTGRRGSKALRTAVLERDGWVCEDCGFPKGLEGDHTRPWSVNRTTRYTHFGSKCRRCHKIKTAREAPVTIRAGRERAEVDGLARARVDALVVEHRRRRHDDRHREGKGDTAGRAPPAAG